MRSWLFDSEPCELYAFHWVSEQLKWIKLAFSIIAYNSSSRAYAQGIGTEYMCESTFEFDQWDAHQLEKLIDFHLSGFCPAFPKKFEPFCVFEMCDTIIVLNIKYFDATIHHSSYNFVWICWNLYFIYNVHLNYSTCGVISQSWHVVWWKLHMVLQNEVNLLDVLEV